MSDFINHIAQQFHLPFENPVVIFTLILFIILLSPILLRKLNIPGIIGLIIFGIIIGPHGLNLIEKNSAVDLFSTIGILYLMFIAGLELDLNQFNANKYKSVVFGLFTFMIPSSIGFIIFHYLLGYGLDASLLTASMFGTHTLVSYPIVSKFGVSKNQAVAVTVGGTILTDMAVLIVLAVILSKSQGNLSWLFGVRLLVSLIIFSAIVFAVIPKIAKWFFQKFESEKHSHYIFILAMVFLSSFLAEIAGLEPIIGAFAAGVALNKLIPESSALMNRIEFLGNSLFIPFFLISVGMLVDVSVILSGPTTLIVAACLVFVAVCGKWIAAWLTQKVFKFTGSQRQLIYGMSGSLAAVALAVVSVGYDAKIIDDNILNAAIILILVSCIIASFATEKAAKKIVAELENDPSELMNTSNVKDEQILLPIANMENIEKLMEFSIFIKDKKSINPISVLSVVSNNSEAELNIVKARNKFEELVKQGAAAETKIKIITTIDYNAASGIARISREILADFIILGWPKRTGFLGRLIGEKVDSIINITDKNTFICYLGRPLNVHKKIVLAVPPYAEYEFGFEQWLEKIAELSQELSIPVQLICNKSTEKAFVKLLKKKKMSIPLNTSQFDDWDDFIDLIKHIGEEDLLVLISARKGGASYQPSLEHLPFKLEKHFPQNSRIVIYPSRNDQYHLMDGFDDINSDPLHQGIRTFKRISREIGSVFNKG